MAQAEVREGFPEAKVGRMRLEECVYDRLVGLRWSGGGELYSRLF